MGMNEELPPVTKLTRYAIRFDLPASQVGTILGLFVGQVEAPKVEPLAADGSTFRMSALATLKQIHEVFGLIVEHGANVVLSPFVEKVSESVRPFQSRPQNVELPPGATITRLPVGKRKRTRVAGGLGQIKRRQGRPFYGPLWISLFVVMMTFTTHYGRQVWRYLERLLR